jgi:predicted PurR-regulated permease PerM
MNYFFANLGAHVVMMSLLIFVCCIFADKVRRRKSNRIIKYFLPVLLTVIIVIYGIFIVVPRMLDIRVVINNNYSTLQGTVESVSPLKNYITINGVNYYKNPSKSCPEPGDKITIRYAEASSFMPEWQPAK